MVREPDGFGELRAVLVASVRSGRVICVRSPAHDDESALAKEETWFELNELARDLSPGVRFLTAGEIENNEIRVAARELLGKAPGALWPEAFTADPHTSSEPTVTVLGGEVRLRTVLRPTELDRAEVVHQKDKEGPLTEAYREAGDNVSFEELCEAYLHALLEWRLGPLASTSKFLALLKRREREVAEEQERGDNPLRPGSTQTRERRTQASNQPLVLEHALGDPKCRVRGRDSRVDGCV